MSECRYCKALGHKVSKCPVFVALHVSVRRRIAKAQRYCFSCLGNHLQRDCPDSVPCDNCGGRHLQILCLGAKRGGRPLEGVKPRTGGRVNVRTRSINVNRFPPPHRGANFAAAGHRSTVTLDNAGYTKGFGFVRFGNEKEQRSALHAMNGCHVSSYGYTGLGTKPLNICTAVPRPNGDTTTQAPSTTSSSTSSYSSGSENEYYDLSQNGSNNAACSGYYGQEQTTAPTTTAVADTQVAVKAQTDELDLVDLNKTIDIDQMNQEFLDTELSLWDSLEASQWFQMKLLRSTRV